MNNKTMIPILISALISIIIYIATGNIDRAIISFGLILLFSAFLIYITQKQSNIKVSEGEEKL